jgi:putative toxin-antitoxin system antitoxin component (TIGR02293 family)
MAARQRSEHAAKKRSKGVKRIWSKADIRALKGMARKGSVRKIAKALPMPATEEVLNRSRAKAVEALQRAVFSESVAAGGVEVVQKGIESSAGYFEAVSTLLGGRKVLGSKIASELEAHRQILQGLPGKALTSLTEKLHDISAFEVSEAVGMSLRTLQRHKSTPVDLLDTQQSGRAWKFAEILAKATRVLGSQDEAEAWLKRPAIGLDQQRPINLLTTPAGVKLVEDYLGRLEYDVYT